MTLILAVFTSLGAATPKLEIHALDIWARPLPASAKLVVKRGGRTISGVSAPKATLDLVAGAYEVSLTTPDFKDLSVSFDVPASGPGASLNIQPGLGPMHGISQIREDQFVWNPPRVVYTLVLGQRHRWFSAQGRPPRAGSGVRLLMDGEETWSTVADEVKRATKTIHTTTWWWDSTFELLRPVDSHHRLSESERRMNTLLRILDSSPAVKRALVWQPVAQDGVASWLTSDSAVRSRGEQANDNFEFMGQANSISGRFRFAVAPFLFQERLRRANAEYASRTFTTETPVKSNAPEIDVDLTKWPIGVEIAHGAHHQKMIVVDSRVAFVSGMNYRDTDWDTSAHRVFEPRRVSFSESLENRRAIRDREKQPATSPRKDYSTRLTGPIVRDVEEVVKIRWDRALAARATNSDRNSAFNLSSAPAAVSGGVEAQLTTTMPAPYGEHSIIESMANAIRESKKYVFIENQYFRNPALNNVLFLHMNAVPALKLVVVTMPVSEWTDPGCVWTHKSHARFRDAFPGRYLMLQLRSFETTTPNAAGDMRATFANINTHSKLIIVDDRFLSVGSANFNHRSMVYDTEAAVVVLDGTWVRSARRRILGNMLGPTISLSNDVSAWFTKLKDVASVNDAVRAAWLERGDKVRFSDGQLPRYLKPLGFLYALDFREASKCLLESVGPDMT